MKKLLLITIVLLSVAACQRRVDMPETTSAAYDIYRMYADREDVTVAMVGDYTKDCASYNAVMLRARDSVVWRQLLEEFAMDGAVSTARKAGRILYVSDEAFQLNCVCDRMRRYVDHKIDSIVDVMQTKDIRSLIGEVDSNESHHSSLLDSALRNGDKGYVVVLDERQQVLWLFVFGDIPQLHAIIDHVFSTTISSCCKGIKVDTLTLKKVVKQ